jgi:ABC-type dipeptide/oligopeptide/nickel transport system permease subunit
VSATLVIESPARPRALARAARVVSWPLAVGYLAVGLVWRFALAPFLRRDATGHGGFDRVSEFGAQSVEYLTGATDRVADLSGRERVEGESPGPWHEAKRRLLKSPLALWSWMGFAVYVYVAFLAQTGVVASDFRFADRDAAYAAPGEPGHWLGTDAIGRDVLALALRGTMTALWIGAVAASLACAIGMVLGAVAGFFGGFVDEVVVWLYTTLESIPQLLLLLAFAFVVRANPWIGETYDASFLKTGLGVSLGLFSMIFTIGITSWVGVCRSVRGEFIRQRDRDYVTAARAVGIPTRRIVFRHVLPNTLHLVLVSFSLLFVSAVKFEVILSFLGLGLEEGEASWGAMIAQAKLELLRTPSVWWQLTTATVFMFGLVLCVNLFADALRDALDPRLKT